MAIPDLDTHGKHIGYTMTLAAAGFAYTNASYSDGATLFGQEKILNLDTSDITAWLLGGALVLFLLATILGVFVIFGMTGISQLNAHKASLESQIESERMERNMNGVMQPTPEEVRLVRALEATTTKIDTNTSRASRRSERHLAALIFGFGLALVLFADSKLDPDPPARKCQIEINAEGFPVLPVKCVT